MNKGVSDNEKCCLGVAFIVMGRMNRRKKVRKAGGFGVESLLIRMDACPKDTSF